MTSNYKDPFAEAKEAYQPNPKSLDGVPDLCMLTYLGEQNILHNLEFRYTKKAAEHRCYTSTTNKVLVALNPYERMDTLYTDAVMKKYNEAEINLEGVVTDQDLPPHVFTVANSAFRNMVARGSNQSIIVCGESGSGKTESAKYMMRFLAYTTTASASAADFKEAEAIGKQILDANPILESFGNAKTLINNNSSRFGKFTKMLFTDAPGETKGTTRKKLFGAAIDSYLLEKSRVVFQDKGERNYHIFYQLTHEHKQYPALQLASPESFNYLARSECFTLDDLRHQGASADAEWHKELVHAYKTLDFSATEVLQAHSIVAGILHLGNITFKQKKGEGSDIENLNVVDICVKLFDVDKELLMRRLDTRTMYLPGDKTVIKPLNEDEARFNRDSVCRNLYNGLFRWVVWRINKQSAREEAQGVTWIGILDVFGFEIFKNNSFEQFCINFANERLQQYFNEHVLQAEQDLYKREALLWDPIDLPNNQDCIDLVSNKTNGILTILDSTCVQPKGDDKVFVANLFNAHKYHPRLRKAQPMKANDSDKQMVTVNGFSIRHYAGQVLYNCDNFLTKNSDASEHDTLLVFVPSKAEVTSMILKMQADGTVAAGDLKRSNKRAFLSTGSVFSDQLATLMGILRKTSPYFVRCVKPNGSKQAKTFIGDFVRPQLRCGGLIEALRIIKLGFPTRCPYKRIHDLFGVVLKAKPVVNLNLRDFAQAIMMAMGDKSVKLSPSEYQLGLTMVFFRPGKQTFLTDILDKKAESVKPDDVKYIRKFLIRKRWKRGIATVKALLRSGKMLAEMRFKKAALSMVIFYRTFGKVLQEARNTINGKMAEAEEERKKRDMKLQEALRAAQELKRVQEEQKKAQEQMEKMTQDSKKQIEQKEAEINKLNQQLQDFMLKVQDANAKLQENEQKRMKLLQNSKNSQDELQQKLDTESTAKQRAEARLVQLEAQLAAKEEAVQASNSDKQTQVDALKREIATLKEQMSEAQAAAEKDIKEKERVIADERAKAQQQQEEMQATVRQKESEISKLNEDTRRLEGKFAALKEEAQSGNKSASDKYSQYEREIAELKRRIAELEGDVATLKSRLEQVQQQATEAARKSAEALAQAREEARLQQKKADEDLAAKQGELSALQQELAAVKVQSEHASKSAAEQLAREREEAKEAVERFEQQLAEKDTTLNEAKRGLALAQGRLESAQAASSDDSRKVQQLNAEFQEKLQEQTEKNDRAMRKLQGKMAELQSDLAIANSRWEDAKRDLQVLQGTLEDTKATNDRLLSDKDRQLQELKGELRKVQARLEQLTSSSAEQTIMLQDQLNDRRSELSELQAKYDKDMFDRNNELSQARAELDQVRNREVSEREMARAETQSARDQLEAEKKSHGDRAQMLQSELTLKQTELAELKEDMKNEKKDRAAKQERLEAQVATLEKELTKARDQLAQQEAKLTGADKTANIAVEEYKNAAQARESKLMEQLEALRRLNIELEAQNQGFKEMKSAGNEELTKHKQSAAEKEEEYKEQLRKQKEHIDRLEHDFVNFKSGASAASEADKQALKGQVELLKTVNLELKADKAESQAREEQYRQRLKEASDMLGEARSELKNVDIVHQTELEKLRLQLQAARERLVVDAQAFQDQSEAIERQLVDKTALINELQSDLAESQERESQATAELRSKMAAAKEELKRLRTLADELQMEQKEWADREIAYESRVAKLGTELVEVQAALALAEHQKELALTEIRTELDVANAKLEADRKAIADRELDIEKELKLHKERYEKELLRLSNMHDRDVKQREQLAVTQQESYQYKLKYFELSQADFKRERASWAEKDRETRKRLIEVTSQLREVQSKHRQTLELQNSTKALMDSRDLVRSQEQAAFELRQKSLAQQQALDIQAAKQEGAARASALQSEVERLKAQLDLAQSEIADLREQRSQLRTAAAVAAVEVKHQERKAAPAPAAVQEEKRPASNPPSPKAAPAPKAEPVAAAPVHKAEPVVLAEPLAVAAAQASAAIDELAVMDAAAPADGDVSEADLIAEQQRLEAEERALHEAEAAVQAEAEAAESF